MKNNVSKKELDEFLGPANTDGLLALKKLNLPKNSTILDVGTGIGISPIFLALNGYKVVTGEPETDNSVYAKMDWEANAERFGVKDSISFRAFDASGMPFETNSFDAVVFFGTLHHIDESQRKYVITEGIRVCKFCGYLVFFEPTDEMIVKIKKKFPDHPMAANPLNSFEFQSIEHIQGKMMNIYLIQNTMIEN
ncbi:MAG: methyltransferase domain-containing protein [Bacteroidota bacterium]